MKVEVFHNVSKDGFFGLNTVFESVGDSEHSLVRRAAQTEDEKHQLVKVFEFEDAAGIPDSKELEFVWHEFNVGTGAVAQGYRLRRLRSLSVGDVVTLNGLAYSVESVGWQRRFDPELRVVEGDEAVKLVRERYDFRPAEELNVTVPWVRP